MNSTSEHRTRFLSRLGKAILASLGIASTVVLVSTLLNLGIAGHLNTQRSADKLLLPVVEAFEELENKLTGNPSM